MSYRKTRLIQERNLLLERKYILEQAPPPPPPPPVAGTPPPPPPPVAGTPPPPAGVAVPPTGVKEIKVEPKDIKEKIKEKLFCSKTRQKLNKTDAKEIVVDGKKYNYYLTTDKQKILCIKEISQDNED